MKLYILLVWTLYSWTAQDYHPFIIASPHILCVNTPFKENLFTQFSCFSCYLLHEWRKSHLPGFFMFFSFSLAFFQKKNLPPFFLLKIASLMAETNFTLGPTSKTNKFPLLFLVIVGQNSQHKRANLNGRTPLDIYSNNFRPSVKHVLGVLEWFYMLNEKILFPNNSFVSWLGWYAYMGYPPSGYAYI